MLSRRLFPFSVVPLLMAFTGGWATHASPATLPQQFTFAETIHVPGISQAAKVNEFLYRGTQPTEEGVKQLKKLGVDTIVDYFGTGWL